MKPGNVVDGRVGLEVTGEGDGASLGHCVVLVRPTHADGRHRYDCRSNHTTGVHEKRGGERIRRRLDYF